MTPPSGAPSILAWRIGLAVVIAVVLARCLPVLSWADIYFDADQAVVGLMAKHAGEGRAVPAYQYAHQYVLMIEAWLAAPLMAIGGSSVVLLKSVPVALNVAVGGMLYAMLTASPSLGPFAALVAVAPIVLPGEISSRELTDAIGMNIEPLLFTLILWVLRERPILLGITAAVAVKNREFALYAIAALVVVDLVRDRSGALWRGRLLGFVAFAAAWSGIEMFSLYSTPLGPGSTLAMLTDAGDNVSVAASAMCIDPRLMPGDVWTAATRFLPVQFGIVADARSTARAYGAPPMEAMWLWAPLVMVLALGAARGVIRAWRTGPSPTTWLGAYLILVGAQAVIVYTLTRCGHVSTYTIRYTLLALFVPAGAIALTLERETHTGMRALIACVLTLWLGVIAAGYVTLARALGEAQPQGTYRRLATYLEDRGVQFIVSDYWTGYHVAFLTGERIKALTNFERVHEYTLAVRANLDRAVEVRRVRDARCASADVVAGFYVCPPIASSP